MSNSDYYEEGEIRDDYEFIISSDEECSMLQRIKELEATNDELEKIARISGSYNNQYNYPVRNDAERLRQLRKACVTGRHFSAQIPSDVSSISSVELPYPTPKKKKRHKKKSNRSKTHEQTHLTPLHYRKHPGRRHQHNKNNGLESRKSKHNFCHTNKSRMCYDNVLETISLNSSVSSVEDYPESIIREERRDSGTLYLNRAELRFALARSGNNENYTGNLRDRLQCEKVSSEKRKHSIEAELVPDDSAQVCVEINDKQDEDSDGTTSLEEQELRLIALKSAVMKKHMARKKRNAELAYSPTDFDDVLVDDNMDIVDLDDMPADMNVSPIPSPKLILDTEQDIEELSSGAASIAGIVYKKNTGDTKPVDMDIANSESDDDIEIIQCSDDNFKWPPIELPPAGMLMPEMCMPYSMHYGIYMPEMQYEAPPPPPPPPPPPLGIADYEETQPPPPPNSSIGAQNVANESVHSDMECASENEQDIQPIQDNELTKDLQSFVTQENSLDSLVLPHKQNNNAAHSDEEEEEALRALLLAKLQSPKHSKSNSSVKANHINNCATTRVTPAEEIENTTEMGTLLPANISTAQELKKNPTELILKEAVRRLKIKPTTECALDFDTENEIKQQHDVSSRKSQNNSPLAMQNSISKNNRASPDVLSTKENMLNIVQDKTTTTIHNRKHKLDEDIKTNAPNQCSKVFVRSVDTINEDYVLRNLRQIDLDQAPKDFHTKSDISEPQHQYINETNEFVNNFNNKQDNCIDKALKAKVQVLNVREMQNRSNKIVTQSEPLLQPVNTATEKLAYVSHDVTTTDMLVTKCNSNADITVTTPATNGISQQSDTAELAKKTLELNAVVAETVASAHELLAKTSTAVMPAIKQTTNAINMNTNKFVKSTKAQQLPLLATKIVKPNKIINTNIQLKSFESKQTSKNLEATEKTTTSSNAVVTALTSLAQSSRLITAADLAKTTVKNLIISLRPTDSDSEITTDDEITLSSSTKACISICADKPTLLSCTINNNYYDNASPISLPMDSPTGTPLRSNSPCIEAASERILTKAVVNDFFEQKLNNFLRDVRSKVHQSVTSTVPTTKLQIDAATNYTPPVAVRHLPEASQKEYQNLLHRMKMLEKQKHGKCNNNEGNTDADVNDQNAISQSLANTLPTTQSPTSSSNAQVINTTPATTTVTTPSTSVVVNNTLIKKVLVKNATSNNEGKIIPVEKLTDSKKHSSHSEPSKTNVLRAYESSFLKIGTSMVANLNKSLKLVDEAKKAKIAKLCHEHRLKELRMEMEQVEHKLNQAEKKIKKINPEIRSSNNVLISLRQRRTKLFQAATSLGKSIKGDDYRLNSEIKNEITVKTKKLAAEIKHVNSIKYSDIAKLKLESANDENNAMKQAEIINNTQNTNSISLVSQNDKEIIVDELQQSAASCVAANANSVTTNESVDNPEQNKTKVQNEQFANSDKLHCDMIGETAHGKDDIPPCTMVKSAVEVKEVTEEDAAFRNTNDATDKDNSNDENKDKVDDDCQKPVEELTQAEQSKHTEECGMLREYISPLANLRTQQSDMDPTGIICPYELKGQCEDNDCSYIHLTEKVKTE